MKYYVTNQEGVKRKKQSGNKESREYTITTYVVYSHKWGLERVVVRRPYPLPLWHKEVVFDRPSAQERRFQNMVEINARVKTYD